ncbi:Alcohol dehydrogenase 2 [Fusarium oxysporum f. sp. albedinis]|nr:Alcohol dehydrogenase 2 [Fusarium oxysporum f. sp. albedinis]
MSYSTSSPSCLRVLSQDRLNHCYNYNCKLPPSWQLAAAIFFPSLFIYPSSNLLSLPNLANEFLILLFLLNLNCTR